MDREVMEYECDDGDWWVKTGKDQGCVAYIVVSVTMYVYTTACEAVGACAVVRVWMVWGLDDES